MSPNYERRMAALKAGVRQEWNAFYEAVFDTLLVAVIAGILAFGCHLRLRTYSTTRGDFRGLQLEADRLAGQAGRIADQHEERP
jgi:hypothetical protein